MSEDREEPGQPRIANWLESERLEEPGEPCVAVCLAGALAQKRGLSREIDEVQVRPGCKSGYKRQNSQAHLHFQN